MSFTIRVVVILVIFFFFTRIDFTTQISSDSFFSASDPVYQEYQKISKTFPPKESLILIIKSKIYSIQSNQCYRQVVKLTNKILTLKGVESVFSLSYGPKNPVEANESLIWKEIIFGESNSATSSTLITSAVNQKINPNVVAEFEVLVKENKSDSFEVELSGTPYVVEMIKRYLYKDLKILTLTILAISTIMILLLFRSWQVLIGTLLTAIAAVLLSLILIQFFKIPFGILSPNLAMVIFLITQSHIIFLTANYFNIGKLDLALKRTFPPSFWSMVAVFCGFWSLSMVQIKPIWEFGFAGMIGTVIAISFAYLLYPVTLHFVHPQVKQNSLISKLKFTINKPRYLSYLIVSSLCLILGLGIFKLGTGASVINYFAKGSEVRKGILALDRNGGSSTLRLIVSHPGFGSLDNDAAFNAMDALHTELANHKDVGVAVSLPLLMKESKRSYWITKFLSWNKMLDILSGDSHQNVASRFMTRDRKQALFILRMKESEHNKPKAEIIKSIEKIVNKYGFKIDYKGGSYSLQAQLAMLLQTGLYQSLLCLLISFSAVAVLASRRNTMTSFAMIFNIVFITLAVLGSFGFIGVAIDLISFPIIISCLLLAMDILIHIAIGQSTLDEQFNSVLSILIVNMSFMTLCFSDFMPMQYCGLAMLVTMVLLGLMVMIISIERILDNIKN